MQITNNHIGVRPAFHPLPLGRGLPGDSVKLFWARHPHRPTCEATRRWKVVYGPGQERSAYGTVITSFVDRLKAGKSPEIHGDGLQTRDFVYVTDVVEAIGLALGEEGSGVVYNIGSGKELSIIDLERALSGALDGKRIEPRFGEPRAGDIRRSVADITKARTGLGFNPRMTLESGLSEMLKQ